MQTMQTSSKGRVVIPKIIREALGISTGMELDVELLPGEGFKVVVRSTTERARFRALAGSLRKYLTAESRARSDTEAVVLAVRDEGREERRLRSDKLGRRRKK